MNWTQVLTSLQALFGKRVKIVIAVAHPEGATTPPLLSAEGVLQNADTTRAQEIADRLGTTIPGDEAITFVLAEDKSLYFTLVRSLATEADNIGVGGSFYVVQGNVTVAISDPDEDRELYRRLARRE